MTEFNFTDSIGDNYRILIYDHTVYVSSDNRIPSIIDGDPFKYHKTIYNCSARKKLEYYLDSSELVNYIWKILNNKAFW
jgi:hypothetical protein